MQFSKIGSYSGGGRKEGSLSLAAPITNLLKGTLSSQASFKSGVTQIQLVDLDTQEAQQALKQLAGHDDFKYYHTQGWPNRIVDTMIVEGVQMTEKLFIAIGTEFKNFCSKKPKDIKCWTKHKLRECNSKDIPILKAAHSNGIKYIQLRNISRSKCQYFIYQWFLDAFEIAGGAIDFDPPEENKDKSKNTPKQNAIYRSDKFAIDVNVSTASSKKITEPKTYNLFFPNNPRMQELWKRQEGRKDTEGRKIRAFEYVFRSPERMVRYLGGIIKAETLANKRYTYQPLIRIGNVIVPLFSVKRGMPTSEKAAIAIDDPEGEKFWVAIPDHSTAQRDRTLQVLAFVMEFLNGAISGKSLPSPNTLVLSSN